MKNIMILSLFLSITLNCNFNDLWYETQEIYQNILQSLDKTAAAEIDSNGCHSEWLKFRQSIKSHLLDSPKRDFLNSPAFIATMVISGLGKSGQLDLHYLNTGISTSTASIINTFKETDFHLVPKECAQFNCTATSLRHLFYLAKILETWGTFDAESIKTIVEFGGGFGNLGHIINQLFPETTYIIFDVPEVIAVQHIFLKGALEGHPIKVHTKPGEPIQQKAINLIPSAFCDETNIQADLFISTFALSETSAKMQEIVIEKKYFNARMCYIVGQLFQKTSVDYTNHALIHESAKELFKTIRIAPFHAPADCNCTYELIASQQ